MDRLLNTLAKSEKCKQKIANIKNGLSHTIMLVHDNVEYLEAFSRLLIASIECTKGILCTTCPNCEKILNCSAIDIFVYPTKNSLLTEDVEEILDTINLKPSDLSKNYYIIKNIENSNLSVQNKLLKSLEEPPQHTMFILLCTNEKSVLPTISSRAEKIVLNSFDDLDYDNLYPELNINELNFAKSLSGNDFGKMLKYVNNLDYYDYYNKAKSLVQNMQNTTSMLEYSSLLVNTKSGLLNFFEMLSILLRDCLMIKNNAIAAVINNWDLINIQKLSEGFSKIALTKILQETLIVKDKLFFNANVNGVIDTYLLNYLEVKNTCKQ